MSKRARDFAAHLEAPLKDPHVHIEHQVNPFEVMMAAARAQRQQQPLGSDAAAGTSTAQPVQQQQQQAAAPAAAPPLVPCTHCRRLQQVATLHQCESCQDVFCSTCSTSNYDERDVRTFCFDCNAQAQAGGAACSSHWQQQPALASGVLCPGTLPPSARQQGAQGRLTPFSAGHQQLSMQLFASPFQGRALPSPQGLGAHSPYSVIPLGLSSNILGM